MICECENVRYTRAVLYFIDIVSQNKTKQPQSYAWNEHNDACKLFVFTHLHSMILDCIVVCVCQNKCVSLNSHSIQLNFAFERRKKSVRVRQHIKYHSILRCLNLIRVFCAELRSRALVRLFISVFYNAIHFRHHFNSHNSAVIFYLNRTKNGAYLSV